MGDYLKKLLGGLFGSAKTVRSAGATPSEFYRPSIRANAEIDSILATQESAAAPSLTSETKVLIEDPASLKAALTNAKPIVPYPHPYKWLSVDTSRMMGLYPAINFDSPFPYSSSNLAARIAGQFNLQGGQWLPIAGHAVYMWPVYDTPLKNHNLLDAFIINESDILNTFKMPVYVSSLEAPPTISLPQHIEAWRMSLRVPRSETDTLPDGQITMSTGSVLLFGATHITVRMTDNANPQTRITSGESATIALIWHMNRPSGASTGYSAARTDDIFTAAYTFATTWNDFKVFEVPPGAWRLDILNGAGSTLWADVTLEVRR